MPLNDKSILITGGTGSFGQAFVKRILQKYTPRRVVIFSRDEFKQFEMSQKFDDPKILRYFLGDVRDADRLRRAMSGIDIIVHVAAIKQVVAAEYNPIECIKTNILGAENVINVAIDAGVKKVLALSTDKAANPINLYGATKLCSDKLFIAGNHLAGGKPTRFSVVRYGNVVGSRGSVIPFFKQKAPSGVLPITDAKMTRFWITLRQGLDFVVNSLEVMKGGETFVPKIPSMKIVDIANAIAPGCKHKIVGIRPGEKLHEVMVPEDEAVNAFEFSGYYIIQPSFGVWRSDTPEEYNGEIGKPVPANFEYRSDNNSQWLSNEDLHKMLEEGE